MTQSPYPKIAASRDESVPPHLPDTWWFGASQFDLAALRAILVRNRWLVLSICGSGLLLGLAITFLTTPTYRAQASIQIDQQASRVMDSPDVEPVQAVQDADRFLQTQLEILQSRALAIRVAQSLHLFSGTSFLDAMRVTPESRPAGTLDLDETRREQVIALLQRRSAVALSQSSRIARISFDSPDPALAARVANAFADSMIAANLSRRYDMSAYARRFLEDQLAQAKERLESSEQAMVDYARQTGIIDISPSLQGQQAAAIGSLTGASLVDANSALSAATSRRIDAQQSWENARVSPPMNIAEVLSNPAVQTLVQRRADMQAAYAEQSLRRQAGHPDLVRASSEMAAIDAHIAKLGDDIRASIRNRYITALRQERETQAAVDRLKGMTINEQDSGIRYTIILREVTTNRELYDGLLQRFKQVSAAAGVSANNISVVDAASRPVIPTSPNLLVNLGLAVLVSFMIATAVVYVIENFDDAIRTIDDVGQKLGVPALGMVPVRAADATAEQDLGGLSSPYAEAFHTIRSAIELSRAGGMPRSILVTSERMGEGKTSAAYALARDFARVGGRRVLLVDADLRRPTLHKVLSLPNSIGMANLLAGQVGLAQAVQPSAIPGLDFVGSGPIAPDPAELLGSPTLGDLLEGMEAAYDLVILDSAPVLGLADAPSLAAHVEATIFIVDAGQSRGALIQSAIRRLRQSQAAILGVIVNRVDVRVLGHAYHSYYAYSEEKLPVPRRWFRR